jgi:outer membrane protein assembly factor BamD
MKWFDMNNYSLKSIKGKIFDSKGLWRAMIFCAGLAALTGCATTGDDDEKADWTANDFYTQAKKDLKSGYYESAIENFETLEARFPFGDYAEQAQIETIYAYYKFEEYDSAIAAADRFIKLHPTHPRVDYAYYMRGLASFHKKDAPLDALFPQDPSLRDPSSARESFNYFADLVKRYPNSKYVPDAVMRMQYQRNTLAKHEINVANYYLKRGAYVAVVNRAKYVVEHYPQTPAVPQALELLNVAYAKLDMNDLATDAKRILEYSYPKYSTQPKRRFFNNDSE